MPIWLRVLGHAGHSRVAPRAVDLIVWHLPTTGARSAVRCSATVTEPTSFCRGVLCGSS
jgi:hypothetical protein